MTPDPENVKHGLTGAQKVRLEGGMLDGCTLEFFDARMNGPLDTIGREYRFDRYEAGCEVWIPRAKQEAAPDDR